MLSSRWARRNCSSIFLCSVMHEGPATPDHDSAAALAKVLTLAGPLAALGDSHSCRQRGGGRLFVKKGRSLLSPNFRGRPAVQSFRAEIPKFDPIFHVADHDGVLRKV